jgi:hypothetical protein
VVCNAARMFYKRWTVFVFFKIVTTFTTRAAVFKLIADIILPTVYATRFCVFTAEITRLRDNREELVESYRER